jgi:LDH2 family malate/lactate/ureidoglycolate dehydrogenase
MVELLAAGLTGSQFSYEAADDNDDSGTNNSPTNHGELIILIDPVVTSGGYDYLQHCETLFERILEEEGTRLPSMRRYANRKKTPLEGITIPLSLYDEIVALGDGGQGDAS